MSAIAVKPGSAFVLAAALVLGGDPPALAQNAVVLDDEEEEIIEFGGMEDVPPGILEQLNPEQLHEFLQMRARSRPPPSPLEAPGQPVAPGEPGLPGAGKPLSEEERKAQALLQRHLQVRFQRQGSQILRALAQKELPPAPPGADPGAPPAPGTEPGPGGEPSGLVPGTGGGAPPRDPAGSKVEGFHLDVVTGDWEAVRTYLAGLPPRVGEGVYGHLVQSLLNDPQLVLLPAEIPPLVDASPATPREDELLNLGRVLARSLRHLETPQALFQRLRAGTRYLGGPEPARRIALVRLLLGAGLIAEAGDDLPPLAEDLAQEDPKLLNLHSLYLEAVGRKSQEAPALRRARELCLRVLEAPALDGKVRSEALQRMLGLLFTPPEEEGFRWLRETFRGRRGLGLLVLAEAGARLESSYRGRAPAPRLEALRLLHRLVRELLAVAGDEVGSWSTALQVLTLDWLNEAQKLIADPGRRGPARSRREFPEPEPQPLPDPRLQNPEEQKIPALPAADLLAHCPDEPWCEAVGGDLARRMRRLTGLIAARAGDEERARSIARRLAGSEPQVAREIAEETVRAWAARMGKGGGSDSSSRYSYSRRGRYYPGAMYSQDDGSSGGIPLTRARQVRNLMLLGKLLASFQELGVPPLDPQVLVQAFEASHSPAEVYRREDLEAVFGDPASLSPEALVPLVSSLRSKLADQWRHPEVQERAGTNRTDRDMVAEIERGYGLAESLLAGAGERHPEEWKLPLLLATVLFDRSEFLYGQKVDLETYIKLRDRSFRTYREAAGLYARTAGGPEPRRDSIEPFSRWFQSALGASDLAFLTRQDEPDLDQVRSIGLALESLGAEARDRHLALFGKALWEGTDELPPQLKPLYLRQGLLVLGDHPAGKDARELLEFYHDLLAEVELALTIDGDAAVGHRRPFGARLAIRHSLAVGRESGGFQRFLLNQQYSATAQRQVDYRDDLEKDLRRTLAEGFEVEVVRFHEPGVEPRGYGRPGWQETPLAYLVLKARDPSVDRLPAVQIDLEFQDGRGVVLLPITSPPALIDAREAAPPARPAAELKVRQLLDDRGLAGGVLYLEVTAGARGLIPELAAVLAVGRETLSGFAIRSVEDQGLSVDSLATAGERIEPVCRRSWRLELVAGPGEAPLAFVFPEARDAGTEVKRERFSDADIVEAPAVVTLRRFVLPRRLWTWAAAGLAAVALAAGGGLALLRARRRRRARASGPRYARPDPLTPFSLIGLLERMQSDPALPWRADERQALRRAIGEVESHFFSRKDGAAGEPDLESVAREWLSRAGGG